MKKFLVFLSMVILVTLNGCSRDTTVNLPDNDTAPMPAETQRLLIKYAVPVEIPTGDNELVQQRIVPQSPPYQNYDVYAVTFLWGSLVNTTPATDVPIDWSGTLSINGVATIDITHSIHFEPNQDSLIATNNPAVAVWVSQTSGDFDGFNCLIYVDKSITYITAPLLTFATAPITKTFYFEQLVELDAFYPVSNTAALGIHARKIYSTTCATGAITGQWVRDDISGQSGSFQAAWIGSDGEPFGILGGTFWTETNSLRLMEGWVSLGATAMVVYHVYGTWYYDDPRMCPTCGSGHGVFTGFYLDSNNQLLGFVKGEFGNFALDPANNNLPLTGFWREFCLNSEYVARNWIR